MAGTPVVAGFLSQAIFWILVPYGALTGELRPYQVVFFVAVWIGGRIAIPWLFFDPFGTLVSSFVAVLDVPLVLMIFKSDIGLT
jgi:hypothetical protein